MQVIDNFVKDPALLKAITNPNDSFWTQGYYWWQNGSPATTLRHKLIDYIWLQGRTEEVPNNFKGFKVIDADNSDLRFKDPKNVICGLKAKGKAIKDFSGFVLDTINESEVNYAK